MQLTFWGAARTVTGSQHLVKTNNQQMLLDCGLFQGRRSETYEKNLHLPFDARQLDAVVLSHAHIDHSGNIPNLFKNGFEGDVFCTHATRNLCVAMLRDSAMIQEENAEFLNRRRKSGEPPIEPMYTSDDAEAAILKLSSINYNQSFRPLPNVRSRFGDAGHMLGSAWELHEINEDGRTLRLCFSGDLGRANLPILRDPQPLPETDYLIIESTYGTRVHEPIEEVVPQLRQAVLDAVERGGKIVVPSFAVERTQELVYYFNEMVINGQLPDVPIFVDSPLAVNVTEVFRMHPECYDDETHQVLRRDPDGNVFGFSRLKYVRSAEQSKLLKDLKGAAVIISASGMAEYGRVLHHLRNTIEDRRNMVLIVSFQAEHTLGRKILEGASKVRILGDEFTVRAEVRQIPAFSGHADRNDLLNWVKPRAQTLRGVFVVHGEEKSALALADGLRGLGVQNVQVPTRGQSFTL